MASASAATDGSTAVTRAELNTRIRHLETAHGSLPEEPSYRAARDTLVSQIREHKRLIMISKPIGARIDSCRSALERAQCRREKAQKTLTEAIAASDASQVEVLMLERDLLDLEQHFAAHPEEATQSLSLVQTACGKLVEQLAANQVDTAHITEAKQLISNLVTGFQSLLATPAMCANAAQQNSTPAPQAVQVPTRSAHPARCYSHNDWVNAQAAGTGSGQTSNPTSTYAVAAQAIATPVTPAAAIKSVTPAKQGVITLVDDDDDAMATQGSSQPAKVRALTPKNSCPDESTPTR